MKEPYTVKRDEHSRGHGKAKPSTRTVNTAARPRKAPNITKRTNDRKECMDFNNNSEFDGLNSPIKRYRLEGWFHKQVPLCVAYKTHPLF